MKRVVVDTNVPIVANGRPDPRGGGRPPSIDCQQKAIDFLVQTLEVRRVLLDLGGEIQAEYRNLLYPSGQPGVGDRFYLEMINSSPQRVERIALPRTADGTYPDFPDDEALRRFDPSDRKFVALARHAHAPVANATDSDWLNFREPLQRNGLEIAFVCGCDRGAWFENSSPRSEPLTSPTSRGNRRRRR